MNPPDKIVYVLSATDSGTRVVVKICQRAGFPTNVAHGPKWIRPKLNAIGADRLHATILIVRSDPFWERAVTKKERGRARPKLAELLRLKDDAELMPRTIKILLDLCHRERWPMPLVLTYEGLLSNPRAVAREIHAHLGVGWNEDIDMSWIKDENLKHVETT